MGPSGLLEVLRTAYAGGLKRDPPGAQRSSWCFRESAEKYCRAQRVRPAPLTMWEYERQLRTTAAGPHLTVVSAALQAATRRRQDDEGLEAQCVSRCTDAIALTAGVACKPTHQEPLKRQAVEPGVVAKAGLLG